VDSVSRIGRVSELKRRGPTTLGFEGRGDQSIGTARDRRDEEIRLVTYIVLEPRSSCGGMQKISKCSC